MQAETWKPLKSYEHDLVTFPLTCMIALPELVGRLGEWVAQQTVRWVKLCQGWSCQELLMSVVPMVLSKESFPSLPYCCQTQSLIHCAAALYL